MPSAEHDLPSSRASYTYIAPQSRAWDLSGIVFGIVIGEISAIESEGYSRNVQIEVAFDKKNHISANFMKTPFKSSGDVIHSFWQVRR